jgi:hypothetical protein
MAKERKPLAPASSPQDMEAAAQAAADAERKATQQAITFVFGDAEYEVVSPKWRSTGNRVITREELPDMPAEQERLIAVGSTVIKKIETTTDA